MQNKKRKLFFLLVTAAVVAIALAAGPLQARSVLGSYGRALPIADQGCFWLSGSTVINGCSSAKQLEFPLITDREGYHGVTVTAYGPSASNNVGCEAVGVNKQGTAFWNSGRRWLPDFGSPQDIVLPSQWVPAGGSMFVNCHLYPNGRINTINW